MLHWPWNILIVENDQRLPELTREYLHLVLPGEDGLSICRKVRGQYEGPILMLTARTDDMDQVLGLEMGADDYVRKSRKKIHR